MLNTQALLTSEKATQFAPARGVAFRSSALERFLSCHLLKPPDTIGTHERRFLVACFLEEPDDILISHVTEIADDANQREWLYASIVGAETAVGVKIHTRRRVKAFMARHFLSCRNPILHSVMRKDGSLYGTKTCLLRGQSHSPPLNLRNDHLRSTTN